MITKMKYVSISGHIKNMDYVINNYLSRYNIQLEENQNYSELSPFTTINPYSLIVEKAATVAKFTKPPPLLYLPLDNANAVNTIEETYKIYETQNNLLRKLEEEKNEIETYINKLQNFTSLNANILQLENTHFFTYCFGKLPLINFLQYEKFLSDNEKIIFEQTKQDKTHTWGLYITPKKHRDETAATFAALNFEPIEISATMSGLNEAIDGSPSEVVRFWQKRQKQLEQEQAGHAFKDIRIAIACHQVQKLYAKHNIKNYAKITPGGSIFTFFGWMTAGDATALEAETDRDNLTVFAYEPDPELQPTKLKNPPIFSGFEFFTKLYGLPKGKEIDPTPFLAIMYTLLFGFMFGDVGHGLTLGIIGFIVHLKKHKPLGHILIAAGASSAIFGFLYGSLFGFEDILPALWRQPAQDINGTLLTAVAIGVAIIALSMFLNMLNTYRSGDIIGFLFGANGVAGFIFYAAAVFIGVRVIFLGLPFTWSTATIAVVPISFVAIKHPLQLFIQQKPMGKGLIFSTLVELFETLLAYVTNTVSFVRAGAFAVSHAGLMHVVLQLAQGSAGSYNWLIIVLGNVLVLGIEGLLVGIQVLRLGFYEMFSRFYSGGGRAFVPQTKI